MSHRRDINMGRKWMLPSVVMAKSWHSSDWNSARLEWQLIGVEDGDDETCLCGHRHIRKCATIYNPYTQTSLHPIGSECIKKFGVASLVRAMELNLDLIELSNVEDYSKADHRQVLRVIDHIVDSGGIAKAKADEFKKIARRRIPSADDKCEMEDVIMSAVFWCQDRRSSLFVPSEGNFAQLVASNSKIANEFSQTLIAERVLSAIENLRSLKGNTNDER